MHRKVLRWHPACSIRL